MAVTVTLAGHFGRVTGLAWWISLSQIIFKVEIYRRKGMGDPNKQSLDEQVDVCRRDSKRHKTASRILAAEQVFGKALNRASSLQDGSVVILIIPNVFDDLKGFETKDFKNPPLQQSVPTSLATG